MTKARSFTPNEAAFIAGLPVKAVHKIIDEDLPSARLKSGRRGLKREDVLYVTVLAGLRRSCLKAAPPCRSAIRKEIAQKPWAKSQPVLRIDEWIAIDWEPIERAVEDGFAALARASEGVESNPEILAGEPVFVGTRVPVYLVAKMLAENVDEGRLLKAYPSLTADMLDDARVYAKAYPRRGRPSAAGR